MAKICLPLMQWRSFQTAHHKQQRIRSVITPIPMASGNVIIIERLGTESCAGGRRVSTIHKQQYSSGVLRSTTWQQQLCVWWRKRRASRRHADSLIVQPPCTTPRQPLSHHDESIDTVLLLTNWYNRISTPSSCRVGRSSREVGAGEQVNTWNSSTTLAAVLSASSFSLSTSCTLLDQDSGVHILDQRSWLTHENDWSAICL